MRRGVPAVALWLILALGPAMAQDRAATLADIRQEMTVMSVELQKLKRELSTTGSGMSGGGGGGPLERVDAMERELQRLTAKTEELEFRIRKVVEDGTNRIDDLKFRLTELEGGDVGQIGETAPLGGEAALDTGATTQPERSVELAVGEQADFDSAAKLSESGTPADAFAALTRFVETYPRSPLAPEAHFKGGKALSDLGNTADAGRAYLEAYTLAETSDPDLAATALFNLGQTLATLEQTREACLTLGQVTRQFPDTDAAREAGSARATLTCS